MEDVNKVRLVGRMGKDPEVKFGSNGNARCAFSVATTDKYTSKAGEKVENTTWHNVILWGKPAEKAGEELKKGSRVQIDGKIQTRKYTDKAGLEKTITEITAFEAKPLSAPPPQKEPPPTADDFPF